MNFLRTLLAICGLFSMPLSIAGEQGYVLLLASYHPGFAWSDGQITGFRSELQRLEPQLTLRVEYLDSKYNESAPEKQEALARYLRHKYGGQPPRLVVAQDDDALDFVLYERHFGWMLNGVPVVFSGVGGARKSTLVPEPGLTGLFDDVDVPSNVRLIQRLRPGLRRLVFVHDDSRSGMLQAQQVREWQTQFPGVRFDFLSGPRIEDVADALAKLGDDSAVIALVFNHDASGRIFSHEEAAIIWGRASAAPVLVRSDVMMMPGVLGGIMASARGHGEETAVMVSQVLAGADPKSLPMRGGRVEPVFSFAALERFGINESALPSEARVLGRPPAIYETHPLESGIVATLFVLGSLIIVVLIRSNRREHSARLAITASEANFREVFNVGNEAIIIHDVEGRIVDVNERFVDLYGYRRDTTPELGVGTLSSGEAPFDEAHAHQKILKSQSDGPQLFEWHARRADGELFWAEVALRSASLNGIPRVLAAVRDISERKKAEAALRLSEQRYGLLLEQSPSGVFHVAPDWTLSYANERLEKLIGWPRERLRGIDIRQLRDRSIMPAIDEALAGREGYYTGQYSATLVEKTFWIELHVAPVRDEESAVIGCIGLVEDISARIEAEMALRELNETLEQRVVERTAELSAANAALLQTMQQLAQAEKQAAVGNLVAGMAHELNTPIGNALLAGSTLAAETEAIGGALKSGGLAKSVLRRFIELCAESARLITQSMERAAALIARLKDLRAFHSPGSSQRFDVREIADLAVEQRRQEMVEQACRVDIDIPAGIVLDSYPQALTEIFSQLIDNTLMHAFEDGRGGTIRIVARRESDELRIDYSDDGMGMSSESCRKAFDPFFTTHFGRGGSGLGLFVVHSLVTATLGGQIDIDSMPGSGVQLCLRLPLKAPSVNVGSTVPG